MQYSKQQIFDDLVGRASAEGGTAMPSAFAIFRFTISSTFVTC
jgi:hypothetical protein